MCEPLYGFPSNMPSQEFVKVKGTNDVFYTYDEELDVNKLVRTVTTAFDRHQRRSALVSHRRRATVDSGKSELGFANILSRASERKRGDIGKSESEETDGNWTTAAAECHGRRRERRGRSRGEEGGRRAATFATAATKRAREIRAGRATRLIERIASVLR